MVVFIGGIKELNPKEFTKETKIVKIKNDIPYSDKAISNKPYLSFQFGSNKKYIVYRKQKNKWLRVGSTYANGTNGVVAFIREVLFEEGDYLYNTGDNARTSYVYYHDGKVI